MNAGFTENYSFIVVACEEVLHPLKKILQSPKITPKTRKKNFTVIFKDFSPLQHPLTSHHCSFALFFLSERPNSLVNNLPVNM
jgi:hypothetical protein